MSESGFHRHFRALTRMTPIQYQQAVRLQQARLALVSSGPWLRTGHVNCGAFHGV